MIRAFLTRRLSDLAHVALHGSDHREHAAVRYALRLSADAPVLPGVVRALGLLEEARRLAHEQEDRAERAEASLVTEMRAVAHARQDAAIAGRHLDSARRALVASEVMLAEERANVPSAEDVAEAKTWVPMMPSTAAALLLRLARVMP